MCGQYPTAHLYSKSVATLFGSPGEKLDGKTSLSPKVPSKYVSNSFHLFQNAAAHFIFSIAVFWILVAVVVVVVAVG